MQRIVQSLSATLTHTFYVGGVATDPSPATATVAIAREDGTSLVASAAATRTATGVFEYTLTPAQTAQLDVLTVSWTATFGGQNQTFRDVVEITGGAYFPIAAARRVKPLDNTTTYPNDRIIEARVLAETALEEACMVAFTPRYFRATLHGGGGRTLLLPVTRPLSVTSATIDGTAVTVADVKLDPAGVLYLEAGWGRGMHNIVVKGTYGYGVTPPRVSRAAVMLAKRYLVDSPLPDRATSLTNEDGTTQLLVTAGVRSAIFDVPEANAIVEEYGMQDAHTVG